MDERNEDIKKEEITAKKSNQKLTHTIDLQ